MKLRENFCIQLFEEINRGAVEGGELEGKWAMSVACFGQASGISIAVAAHTHSHTRTRTRTPNLPHNEFHKLTQIKDTTS